MSIKTKIISLLLLLVVTANSNAQKAKVLFTLNGNKVYNTEFSRVYEKNLSLVNDPQQKEIDNYLELYINYKLKLEEAYELKMDTVPAYKKEFAKYKNQLIEPYLKDANTEKDLITEAYDRMKKEVKASHILLTVKSTASPKDTLLAYNKLSEIRKRILAGASFETEAIAHSQDPSVKKNKGELGYFTVFQMVYPFETAAYTTPVGEISKVIRTKFGYHLLKVHDIRDSKGEVEVAHIMFSKDKATNESQAIKLKKLLDEGADFADLAKQYSQDTGSAKKGGALSKFGTGRMVKDFEKVAFSLKKEGEISQPFKTRYGWHIIKLIKKYPVASFEKAKPVLQKKVIQGKRAKILGKSVISRLLKEYKITENKALISKKITTDLLSDDTILTIEGDKISADEFYKFKVAKRNTTPEEAYTLFKEDKVKEHYIKELPTKFPAFKHTLKEYEEGLLLFDLMQKRIWDKAEKDSVGLADFFEKNKAKYQWKERVNAVVVTCDKEANAKEAQSLLKAGKTTEEIEAKLTKKSLIDIKEGMFEKENSLFPKDFTFDKGVSNLLKDENQFVVIQIIETLAPSPKKLIETRGKVISDYQDFLEKQWIKNLKNKYSVKINKRTLKKLKRKYN